MYAYRIVELAREIAGAAWDDRERTGTMADQLRAVASIPALGSDGDLTEDDRKTLRQLADRWEEHHAVPHGDDR